MARRIRRRVAKKAVQLVRAAPRRAPRSIRRAGSTVRNQVVEVVRSPAVRRYAVAGAKQAGLVALAQARILPAAVGGYLVAKLERQQRVAHSKSVGGNPGSGALVKDPSTRLLLELAGLAIVASRTNGMLKEAACGAAGAVGFAYELYNDITGTNPADSYSVEVKSGNAGI